jgi:hypothetical protein
MSKTNTRSREARQVCAYQSARIRRKGHEGTRISSHGYRKIRSRAYQDLTEQVRAAERAAGWDPTP